jgi:hypothetical protein
MKIMPRHTALGLVVATSLVGCASSGSGDYDYADSLSVGVSVGYSSGYYYPGYGYPGGYYPPPVVVVPPGDRPNRPDNRPPGGATTLPADVGPGTQPMPPSRPPSASTRSAPRSTASRPAPRPMPRARGR